MLLSVPREYQSAAKRISINSETTALSGGLVPGTLSIFVILHVLLWISVPLLFIDGMHVDTLEMAAWGREWALGYPKHPPLGTWLVSIALHLPGLKIFNILVLSQLCIVGTSLFIWKAIRLYSTQFVAAVAVVLFLESASASVFSVQLNHNLLSMPFEAALLYVGLKFLEKPSSVDAVALGLVSGLAFLTKYETAFFHLTLLMAAVSYNRYRPLLTSRRFALAAAISLLVVAPHVYWDFKHGWPTLGYATSERAAVFASDYLASLNNYVIGILTLLVGPFLTLAAATGLRKPFEELPPVSRLGLYIAVTPFVLLAVLSLVTTQVIRQGWLLPLAPALFVGLALRLPTMEQWSGPTFERFAWRALMVSIVQAAAFAIFILVRSWDNHPVVAYALDSSELSERILDYWHKVGQGPLDCIAVPEASRSLTLGPVLYIWPEPKFVLLNPVTKLRAACPAGGLAMFPLGGPSLKDTPRPHVGEVEMSVSPEIGVGSTEWRYRVFPIYPRD